MGREIRRVPKDWQHPRREDGRYQPLNDGYTETLKDFETRWKAEGLQAALDYYGCAPNKEEYMPEWPESDKTHIQMYETCTEGTPISPVMDTPENLARWLADHDASAFGSMTATYEQWLNMCRQGWALSAVMNDGVIESGVAALKVNENG